jgi:hypothetical protein
MFEAFSSARAVAADFSNFCERNPDVCVTGTTALHVFAEKAQNGARLLFRYFDGTAQKKNEDDNQGTLTESDREPTWHGPRRPGTA